MLIKEASAVMDRIEKGKCVPGLISNECYCIFYTRYLLPCKHIFHEHIYGTPILTNDAWRKFQELFEENGFEIYEKRELVIIESSEQTEEEKKKENRRHIVNELTERVRNKYWSNEEMGEKQAEIFINKLEESLNPIINN